MGLVGVCREHRKFQRTTTPWTRWNIEFTRNLVEYCSTGDSCLNEHRQPVCCFFPPSLEEPFDRGKIVKGDGGKNRAIKWGKEREHRRIVGESWCEQIQRNEWGQNDFGDVKKGADRSAGMK